jgi:hypothetical protein
LIQGIGLLFLKWDWIQIDTSGELTSAVRR